jgi:hypothetical protein
MFDDDTFFCMVDHFNECRMNLGSIIVVYRDYEWS